MADTKISDLAAVTNVVATDEYVLARAGATKKIDASNLLVAGSVAFTPTGTIASTDVQAAIAEVAAEAGASNGMVQLFSSTLGSAQASFDATSLSGSYRDLLVELSLFPASGSNGDVYVRFNNDSGSNYDWVTGYTTGSIGGANTGTSDTKIKLDTLDTSKRYVARVNVSDYADTGIHKYVVAQAFRLPDAAFNCAARWASNSAITRVTISLSTGNLQTGSRCRIYGIPAV